MSETPRTDAHERIGEVSMGKDWHLVSTSFARQLERELASAVRIGGKFMSYGFDLGVKLHDTQRDLAAAVARAEKAEREMNLVVQAFSQQTRAVENMNGKCSERVDYGGGVLALDKWIDGLITRRDQLYAQLTKAERERDALAGVLSNRTLGRSQSCWLKWAKEATK